MRYSKPVLSSNVGAVREVLADAPIYFSPLYEADIFQALCSFVNTDYSALQAACHRRYEKISTRQHDDLMTLLNLILCK
jgi:glycosyltransferase involved in cell wall biosynthesis